MGATLDVLSKGRLFMGIGAAWNDSEAKAYGIPFPPTKERLLRLDEAVQIIRKMWTEDAATFNGEFYTIEGALCNPKPIQKPMPKILDRWFRGEVPPEDGRAVRRCMQLLRLPGDCKEQVECPEAAV